jgi:hypothetical protein
MFLFAHVAVSISAIFIVLLRLLRRFYPSRVTVRVWYHTLEQKRLVEVCTELSS